MILLLFFMCFCIELSCCQQYYDPSDCSSDNSFPGSRYTCNFSQNSCKTFLVYRATQHFQTISNISDLFRVNSNQVLRWNNLVNLSEVLTPGREVLVPITCSCSGNFFQANFSYIVPENTTFSEIGCGVFEGLVKSHTLIQENLPQENNVKVGSKVPVPLRCACPDNFSSSNGVKYLVTYPFVEGDGTLILCKKFGISPVDLWAENRLEPHPTVFPNTTVLVPLRVDPVLNFNVLDTPPPATGFLPTEPTQKNNTKLKKLYISVSVVGSSLVIIALLGCGILYVKVLNNRKRDKFQSFNTRSSPISCSTTVRSSPRSGQTARSSTNSCLSPDLLAGIKYSLNNYSIEEIKRATRNFSEDSNTGDQVYKGSFDNVKVMIKQTRFEDTRQIIDVHSKINHKNIVKLLGVCYGEGDTSCSYLVFEYPNNGCLRNCLSNPSSPLPWHRRTQIAFDLATGLHYLHYCTFPTYTHMNINTKNIFVTENWRAKLAHIGSNTASVRGWVAPEYLTDASASEKIDIFSFGVVLLELISGREGIDGKIFKESIGFLGGGASEGGCFDQLRSFVDPCLKEDYPLAEALCLSVLAKACVEDDPLRRPPMDDIMKVIARLI